MLHFALPSQVALGRPQHLYSISLSLALPTAPTPPPPPLYSSPHLGSQAKTWQDHCHMMPMRVMLRWDPPPLRKCSRPFSHPSVPLWRAGHYNRIQLPSQSIPDWFQPLLGYGFPQTMRICYNFNLAGALGIKLWTTKAVYGRTEEFELHNRQLPCPLTPSPSFNLWFVCRWVRLCAD